MNWFSAVVDPGPGCLWQLWGVSFFPTVHDFACIHSFPFLNWASSAQFQFYSSNFSQFRALFSETGLSWKRSPPFPCLQLASPVFTLAPGSSTDRLAEALSVSGLWGTRCLPCLCSPALVPMLSLLLLVISSIFVLHKEI